MIIARTPYRISFFGGGTDLPDYFNNNSDAGVISTTINKYCYISVRELPHYFDHKYRLCYSKIEHFNKISEIEHPSARAVMGLYDQECGLEIHYDGDVPSRSGLASSSAFTVGMLNALNAFHETAVNKYDLASKALYVEQFLNKENVGSQDQVSVCYGGLNEILFSKNNSFSVNPISLSNINKKILLDNCLLFYTGVQRYADEVELDRINNMKIIKSNIKNIAEIRMNALKYFQDKYFSIEEIGKLLHISWEQKKQLSKKVSIKKVDEAYQVAMSMGAYGGKLLGAGGGGFMLFVSPPKTHEEIEKRLKPFTRIKFEFDNIGSSIIFNSE